MTKQHRISQAAERIAARLPRLAFRGQLGPVSEIELARLTGARR